MIPVDSKLCGLSVANVTANGKEWPEDINHERRDQFSHFHFEKIVFLFSFIHPSNVQRAGHCRHDLLQ
jgi:hypothetical protein